MARAGHGGAAAHGGARIAQPNISHSPPMNARAQAPAARAAAPAMPQVAVQPTLAEVLPVAAAEVRADITDITEREPSLLAAAS